MGWQEGSMLRNCDDDIDDYLDCLGGYTESISLYETLADKQEESENNLSDESIMPEKVQKLAIPPKQPSNKKLTQAKLAKKLLSKVEIYLFQDTLYVYDTFRFLPCDRRQIARLLERILPTSDYEALSVNDFRGLYNYLTECSSNIPLLEDLPLPSGYALCKNGKFDIVSEKRLSDSEHFLCLHQIQANYEPEYYHDTPVFDQFLEDISGGDREIQNLIWAVIGYFIIHDPRAKVFAVFGTAGNSGKSQLINLIERLIGSEHVSHLDPQRLGGRFALSALMGCSLNTAADLSSEPMPPEAISQLKKITGLDMVPVEGKYENPRSMFSITKFLCATNHPLKIKQDDSAFFDRMLVIPFLYSVDRENQDKNLLEKLWEERDGIVTRALQAVRKVILNNYEFPYCRQSEMMKESWISACFSNIHNFVKERCDLTNLDAKTSTDRLYAAYDEYCNQKGLIPESKNAFSRSIHKEFSLKQIRLNKLHGYQGIQLKPKKKDSSRVIWLSGCDDEISKNKNS